MSHGSEFHSLKSLVQMHRNRHPEAPAQRHSGTALPSTAQRNA